MGLLKIWLFLCAGNLAVDIFVLCSPILFVCGTSPSPGFVTSPSGARCKRCRETIPAPVRTLPDTWIIADCPLCGERRAYLQSDILRGRLSFRIMRKPVQLERRI